MIASNPIKINSNTLENEGGATQLNAESDFIIELTLPTGSMNFPTEFSILGLITFYDDMIGTNIVGRGAVTEIDFS